MISSILLNDIEKSSLSHSQKNQSQSQEIEISSRLDNFDPTFSMLVIEGPPTIK